MTIYEIDSAILACVDGETGEIIDCDAFDKLQMERNAKIENVACWKKNIIAGVKAMEAEIAVLKQRAAKDLAKAEQLDKYLDYALGGNKFESARCKVSFIKSTETVVDDIGKIPMTFLKEKTKYEPDKKALKSAILSGESIPGVYLAEKRNIQVK